MAHCNTDPARIGSTAEREASSKLLQMMYEGRSYSGRERNRCFLNIGASNTKHVRFTDISHIAGIDYDDDGRAVALTDWDDDGRVDIWISNRNAPRLRLLKNDVPTTAKFLSLELKGNGITVNRDAVGTRVEVIISDGPNQIRTLRAGEGFLSQSSKRMIFGVGDAESITVKVRWPDGNTEMFEEVLTGCRYRISQGQVAGEPTSLASIPARNYSELSDQDWPTRLEQNSAIAIYPTTLIPMSDLEFKTFAGDLDKLRFGNMTDRHSPTLVILWAAWCKPCLVELQELITQVDQVRKAKLQVVALSVDEFHKDSSVTDAMSFLARTDFPFESGKATVRTMQLLQTYDDAMTTKRSELSVPSAFLVDSRGRLIAIFKGKVGLETVLHALVVPESRVQLARRAALLPGRPLEHNTIERSASNAGFSFQLDLGLRLQQQKFLDGAIRQFEALTVLNKDSAVAWCRLGLAQAESKDLEQAQVCLAKSLELDPSLAPAHLGLGLVQAERNNWEEAATAMRKAVMLDPKNPVALNKLAVVLVRLDRLLEAEECYNNSLRLQPDSTEALNGLGTLKLTDGQLAEAEVCFRRANAADPGNAVACRRLGMLLVGQSKNEQAVVWLERAVKSDPLHVESLYNLGVVLINLGAHQRATKYLLKAIALEPHHAEAHFSLGCLFMSLPSSKTSEEHFRKTLAEQSDHVGALSNLGILLAQNHRQVEARQLLEKAVSIAPEMAEIRTNLGFVCLQQDDASTALVHFDHVLSQYPKYAKAREGQRIAKQKLKTLEPSK